jgi:MraZ protein
VLFIGRIENKLDAKGRISFPATFREALSPSCFKGVILHPSLLNPCLEGFSYEFYSSYVDENSTTAEALEGSGSPLKEYIISSTHSLSIDDAGRLTLPKPLMDAAGLTGASHALFLGKAKTFQIWEPSAFAAQEQKQREKAITALSARS